LTALKLRIQSLQRAPGLPEEVTARVTSVERQAERVEKLVDNLLDVARIATGQLGLQPAEVALGQTVADVVDRFRLNPLPNQPEIRLDFVDEVSGFWDRMRVEQVLTNLLTNAIRYAGRQPVQVTVRACSGHVELCVADHGQGIAPADQARIFERFGRVGGLRETGGLGLGLYIASQIVEAHGGDIRVDSQPGIGSRFIVSLPLDPVAV
jgi:signal transduction histidine kinase